MASIEFWTKPSSEVRWVKCRAVPGRGGEKEDAGLLPATNDGGTASALKRKALRSRKATFRFRGKAVFFNGVRSLDSRELKELNFPEFFQGAEFTLPAFNSLLPQLRMGAFHFGAITLPQV